MSSPIRAASGSWLVSSAGWSMEMTSPIRLRSSSRSAGSRNPVMPLSPYLNALATFPLALPGPAGFPRVPGFSIVSASGLFHGGPQPEAVHGHGMALHLLLAAVGND